MTSEREDVIDVEIVHEERHLPARQWEVDITRTTSNLEILDQLLDVHLAPKSMPEIWWYLTGRTTFWHEAHPLRESVEAERYAIRLRLANGEEPEWARFAAVTS